VAPPYLVVMAGGSGTRFWPKSTRRRPKQLLAFGRHASRALLTDTLARFDGIVPVPQRVVVTTASLEEAVAAHAAGARVLAEPRGRNTAPCVYWAARIVAAEDPTAVMLVMPSDHHIADLETFRRTVVAAATWAADHDDLVTLGVRPTHPETGYGYLQTAEDVGPGCRRVAAFVEKPDLEAARGFLAAGTYLWNGGMFAWRAEVILAAFDRLMPELGKAWDESGGRVAEAYPRMTATSIDYGVMERATNVVTFPLDCGWSDLGTWSSLESVADVLGARGPGGVVFGGELLGIDATGNLVDAPGKLVALLGVCDLIVVEHGNAILVAPKSRAQDVRLVVQEVERLRPDLA
jgi:mannose-1-phosphate guanylyltransferase